jgi:hypothetical protein
MGMHAMDLVGINGITRVLLVYTCQKCVYPRGHVLPLRLPNIESLTTLPCLKSNNDFTAVIALFVFTVESSAYSGLKYSSAGCDSW